MKKIRVAIAGVGNCASSLVQGLEYYKGQREGAFAGLMHARIGDWGASDIEIVTAFDIDRRKVGKLVEEAIFAKPNCTKVFQSALFGIDDERLLKFPEDIQSRDVGGKVEQLDVVAFRVLGPCSSTVGFRDRAPHLAVEH